MGRPAWCRFGPLTALAVAAALWAGPAAAAPAALPLQAPCSEARDAAPLAPPPADATLGPAARHALQGLLDAALARSRAMGAARALAEAAARDADEARAATALRAGLSVSAGPVASHVAGLTGTSALQGSAGLSASQTLWDGGRSDALVDWRVQLQDAARLAALSQQEQLALSAVSLALDRERYRAQDRVYARYVSTMACLADALQQVVDADRGRASELVQARKSLQQAELQREAVRSQLLQTEIRLQRLVGELDHDALGLGPWLQTLPPLPQLLQQAERSVDITQLEAQARAADRLARSVAAAARPQLSWSLGASQGLATGGNSGTRHSSTLSLGVAFSVPLTDNGTAAATDAARWRALAATEQVADALDNRRARVRELHEQARSTLDRAARLQAVLQASEQVREATRLQWQQLGRRSLFDVMSAESEHVNLRLAQVNAWLDAQQLGATLRSLGRGLLPEAGRAAP